VSVKKTRLDHFLLNKGLVKTRSQAENYIRLGMVTVNSQEINKPGFFIDEKSTVLLDDKQKYVSRAGLKLASVADEFKVNFKDKVVLDVGSSTGGFTDYVLQNGAKKVYAIDVGTNQLHPSLRLNSKIDLREQTDIRNVKKLSPMPEIVLIDVSFISLRNILPYVGNLINTNSLILAMVKPQFEADNSSIKHKGVIKNENIRRQILKDFEYWVKDSFYVVDKKDSDVAGEKGNKERFYLLKLPKK
jgi:23S rRNA (cytidine1920-2'-O)/16S rRNA (cytidine1409-2'-O)-methyltransferase